MPERFVFLELTDPEVASLLRRMQWVLSGVEPRRPVHLTLRGPYRRKVPDGVIGDLRATLQGDVLRIGGVGQFRNRDEEVVFLHVDSPNLRKVWWKPSYPIKDYGYAPHISLYRGRDVRFARRVADFLKREALDLSCAEYELTVHRRGTLPFAHPAGTYRAAESFGGPGRFDSLLERLGRLVDEHRGSLADENAARAGPETQEDKRPAPTRKEEQPFGQTEVHASAALKRPLFNSIATTQASSASSPTTR